MSLSSYPLLLSDLSDDLQELDRRALRRRLQRVDAVDGATVTIGGRPYTCWCSNDYLGLSTHPQLLRAAAAAAETWGIGARASRLLAGNTAWHERLEQALASWCGAEAVLVFASGYLANLGALGALLGPADSVFIDRLAHASLIDAARHTRARLRVYAHNDPAHLKQLLVRHKGGGRRVIVTEGVFSMDGDRAPLAALLALGERHGALVYLDDAHGAFVTGATGRGTPEMEGVPTAGFLYMGTLGKALGTQGGFIAGSRALIDTLCNRSRTFIYSTALAVPVAAAAAAALEVVGRDPQPRRDLDARAEELIAGLRALGLTFHERQAAHILPVVLGASGRALAVAGELWERGIWAPAIRPPTVPNGTARLRLSVTARHTSGQVDALVAALREALPPGS